MKDNIRDYATEAFRFYAAVGGSEKYKRKILKEILDKQKERTERRAKDEISDPTAYAIIEMEQAMKDKIAELADLEAVEKTMHLIHRGIRQALEIVYFEEADKPLEKGDIERRIHKAELTIPASRRTIYYYLANARKIFAQERGLRLRKNKKI